MANIMSCLRMELAFSISSSSAKASRSAGALSFSSCSDMRVSPMLGDGVGDLGGLFGSCAPASSAAASAASSVGGVGLGGMGLDRRVGDFVLSSDM